MTDYTSTFDVHGEPVSPRLLRRVWHRLYPHAPLPEVSAIKVTPEEWHKFAARLEEHNAICGARDISRKASIREWGEVVEGDAGVVRMEDGFVILIRTDAPHTVEHLLEHELEHIARGEV